MKNIVIVTFKIIANPRKVFVNYRQATSKIHMKRQKN